MVENQIVAKLISDMWEPVPEKSFLCRIFFTDVSLERFVRALKSLKYSRYILAARNLTS